ncbi:MAG: transporter substrate-binding domain-containing protein [Deltaproteobacteria bacterium]|nr:transporter substrate-binding domain-containing protein [Deltaproteobacteria bacterium]
MKKMCFILTLVFVMILASVATAPAGTALDRIQQKGELVVGITGTQPPLNVTTKTGKIIGLDADLAKLIAMNLGVKVKFSPMSFSQPRQRANLRTGTPYI